MFPSLALNQQGCPLNRLDGVLRHLPDELVFPAIPCEQFYHVRHVGNEQPVAIPHEIFSLAISSSLSAFV